MEIILLFWIICTLITVQVYIDKGWSWLMGLIVGLFLGPLGIVVAILKPNRKKQ